ncbi:MAG: zinc-binding dehydrogenase [Bacteroidales bacterium]|jgi:threonine dehydrogenase-like Zn-dependent dehydrogenase|nr:zinc-binding dehydrogenase [Bacteroidales bacterium]
MKTKAVRLYGKNDLRLEEFDLPPIREDEILAKVVSDSICMSSYKAAQQGADHKRVPDDVATRPVMIGHEFCGEMVQVGKKWGDKFRSGMKFSIQPALNYKGSLNAPGYSYRYIGGNATYIVIPNEVMEMDCLLEYTGDAFFLGSLAEPMSCVIGTFHACYHTRNGVYAHEMGVREGGNMAILAGVGPMGLAAINYIIHCPRKPKLLVVTDIDDARLKRAASLYTAEEAAAGGIKLIYLNTKDTPDAEGYMKSLTDGKGYDDVLVFAPVRAIVEQADRLLGMDGCLNFFAGPSDTGFKAELNFYNVHYAFTHVVGTSGGNTGDMVEALEMMSAGTLNPAAMITHVGGLNAVIETTKNLPHIPGGKKLIYTHLNMELTALEELEEKGKTDPLFAPLARIVKAGNGIWSTEAERYLLEHAPKI